MKKIFAALLSASFLLSPMVVSQASADDYRRPPVVHKRVIVEKTVIRPHWKKGYRVNASERRRFSDVNDYRRYRLAPPPRGYRWVRADNDYLLIGVTSGIISSVIAGR
ncbi:Ni/Co efflux regulator RcnB [Rhizobium leguminosarum]|uniref:Ni/Co efflux regulator RcnB n=1 Tax=Rhizobium leguminosarum TaxID=384 RepID=A0AAE2MHY8_RHILE|nr:MULTISPECIES: RcnB family protein [Rhizobium]MBB4289666.1 Ni/Co efflux regulator RcnB [Rhizobium leguminosarum]MBB4296310.1 Ni/Co efflux regulator RcnB [Rhizobium leguminosarum]MBB4308430.1 Ni/Co efflux regulator RcnB [Rhizobium leguminosarum]MBB4416266.1 Ni/Co efflux regulator RcnB [Rhizobium leguminosarum]MBB4430767.1 Ni/Co efflux regulator RcnB [Rhizobium esperanzae]